MDLAPPREAPPAEDLAELAALLKSVKAAQAEYAHFTQEQVDKIFKAAALVRGEGPLLCTSLFSSCAALTLRQAANSARIPLAKMAVEETGMGIVEDKARAPGACPAAAC